MGLADYDNYHYRMKAKFGKPSLCDFCGTTEAKAFQWAHKPEASWDAELENWHRLCATCHVHYDGSPEAVAEANRHRVWTQEMRQKMSVAKSGEKNGFFGRKHTPETRQKISEARKRRNSGT